MKKNCYLTITLNWKPPMGNEILRMQGARRYKYRNLKNQWIMRIKAYFFTLDSDIPRYSKGDKVEILLRREYNGKEAKTVDYGNLVTGFKPCLDALQKLGIIEDDSKNYITEFYEEEKTGRNRIIIKIKKPQID